MDTPTEDVSQCKSRDLEHVYEAFYIAAVRLDVSVQQVDYILT